jgi:hypothetical protein
LQQGIPIAVLILAVGVLSNGLRPGDLLSAKFLLTAALLMFVGTVIAFVVGLITRRIGLERDDEDLS